MKTKRLKRMEKTDCNLEVLFDLFIAEKKLGRSPDTISTYRESHKRFMDFLEEEGYHHIETHKMKWFKKMDLTGIKPQN